MQIIRIPVLSDNYVFLLVDEVSQTAAVVDPAVAEPVLRELQQRGLTLTAIFNTHHHGDHVGGNSTLLKHFPHATVYGGAQDVGRIPGQTVQLEAGDTVTFAGQTARILFVPGHTRAHIAYYVAESQNLFCGDTLFAGGCGRLFEGTPAQMVTSLSQFRELADTTKVWCAHEYTEKNLRFAVTVDPENELLQQRLADVQAARQRNEATVPSELGLEKRTNPFLRWDKPALMATAQSEDPIRVFARIRGKRDQF